MDLTIKKSKKNQVPDNFLLYSVTVLTCSLLCCSLLWFPSLISSMKIFIFFHLPKISSLCLSSKLETLYIVIVLIGESRFFAANTLPTGKAMYISQKRRSSNTFSPHGVKNEREMENGKACDSDGSRRMERKGGAAEKNFKLEEMEGVDGEDELGLPTEELNKRADDFIAKVNRQRILEAKSNALL